MSLIDTTNPLQGIDSILQEVGLKTKPGNTLNEKLKNARLDTETLLNGVSEVISNGDTDNARLKALEMGLKLNPETRAALNDESGKQVPQFNIIIKDGGSVNLGNILMPRLSSKSNVIDITEHQG